MTDKMLEQQRRRMDWAERDDRMVEEIGHGPQPDAVYDPETGSEYQPSANRSEEVTEMNTIAHPSTWVPVRCANEADASLRDGWLPDGAGAQYLLSVVSSLLEAIDYEPDEDRSDQVAYAADSCISVYTPKQWDTFHDLYAWTEDLTELGGPEDDMTKNATAAIYMIGCRLAGAVVTALEEG